MKPSCVIYAGDDCLSPARAAKLIGKALDLEITNSGEEDSAIYIVPPTDKRLNEKSVLYTFYEATVLPKEWVESLNRLRAVIVPSEWARQVFRSSGVTTDVFVARLGVDIDLFYPEPVEREAGLRGFVFGLIASVSPRKGADLLIEAYKSLFSPDEATLLIKTYGRPVSIWWDGEPRDGAVVRHEKSNDDGLRRWYNMVDCFVFPTRCESFGLPPLEAGACGKMVIVSGLTGDREYAKEPLFVIGEGTEVEASFSATDGGKWIEPDVGRLKDMMWRAFKLRGSGHGEKVRRYVVKNWSLDRVRDEMTKVMEAL